MKLPHFFVSCEFIFIRGGGAANKRKKRRKEKRREEKRREEKEKEKEKEDVGLLGPCWPISVALGAVLGDLGETEEEKGSKEKRREGEGEGGC